MRPLFATDDSADREGANAKHGAKLSLLVEALGIQRANRHHGYIAQFGISSLLASGRRHFERVVSTLCDAVSGVVAIGPDEKVGGITAWRVVASVANDGVRWNRAARKLKGHSMRLLGLAEPGYRAIATSEPTSGPRPALVWSAALDAAPEHLGELVFGVGNVHRDKHTVSVA